jgi:hypothetical protein
VVAAGGATWWWLQEPDHAGVWTGRLDTLQIELHLEADGTFAWYVLPQGERGKGTGGVPQASPWSGRWRLTEDEIELRYDARSPQQKGGVRYARFVDGTLRTTFGLGGERASLRRRAP